MPPEVSEPLAPSNGSTPAEVIQLLEQALGLLDTIPNTQHLAAHVQGVIDELRDDEADHQ
jgi:hypothetical protein